MRTRSIKKQVWLNSRENELLKKKCMKAGLSESSFFRLVINDTQIKEKPDENFYKILNDLRGVAVNINQLARVANTYQYVDDNKYYPLANRVNDMIIYKNSTLPQPRKKVEFIMAVTKILTRKTRLDTIIKYIMNAEKTEKMMYVSGVNCRPDTAISEMQDTKKRFDKEDGIISYHLIQSFDEKEISPKKCHELGLQYAKELFGDDFQFVVATHLNTDNVHNHIVVNSVSFKSGNKFYSNRETKDFIRITSDFICRENGLSVIKLRGRIKAITSYMLKITHICN